MNLNERTNTLLYKNISLTLYSRKGDVSCVWEVSGDKDRLLFWPKFFLAHSSTSFLSWLGLLNREPQSLQSASCSHTGIWSPTGSGTWLYNCLMSPCFHCSFAYLHRWISWLTAQSRVSMLQLLKKGAFWSPLTTSQLYYYYLDVSKQITDAKLLLLHGNSCNNLTMCKQMRKSK